MHQIKIEVADVVLTAHLNDSATANKIIQALPVDGLVNTWGNEIYFSIPVVAEAEPDARAEMAVGEIGYWPPGTAFCIFFGPTPISSDEKPLAASPVNIIGNINEDLSTLRWVKDGTRIQLKPA